jgi:hypothetical protein
VISGVEEDGPTVMGCQDPACPAAASYGCGKPSEPLAEYLAGKVERTLRVVREGEEPNVEALAALGAAARLAERVTEVDQRLDHVVAYCTESVAPFEQVKARLAKAEQHIIDLQTALALVQGQIRELAEPLR